MYYYLNKPDEALTMFKDESLDGFFDQYITYQLLLDLLFINERYNDMLDVFKLVKQRQINGTKYPKNVVVLCFAACFKLVCNFYQLFGFCGDFTPVTDCRKIKQLS